MTFSFSFKDIKFAFINLSESSLESQMEHFIESKAFANKKIMTVLSNDLQVMKLNEPQTLSTYSQF